MTPFTQLDTFALELLEDAIKRFGSIQAVADLIGYSRSSVSLARSGKYTGNADKMRKAILTKLNGVISCPYLSKELTAEQCIEFCNRPVPTSSRQEVKHWQACQMCMFNPAVKIERKSS